MKFKINKANFSPSKLKVPKSNQVFYETLKLNINNKFFIDKIMQKDEITKIISNILVKEERNIPEIFIIKTYLSQLKKFMEIINTNDSGISIDSVLTRVSEELQLQKVEENTFLMKIGEKGNNFYVTLSGSVIILMPKEFEVSMNREDYLNHLKLLYNNNENYLMKKILYSNKNIFPVEKDEYEIIDSNYELVNYPIEKYLSRINYEVIDNKIEKILLSNERKIIKENDSIKPDYLFKKYMIKIFGYVNVVELGRGSTFGEVALINDNNLRTASIFVKKKSFFGTLTSHAFKGFMKVFLEKAKRKKISFIFSTPLFKNMNISDIVKMYWNFFVEKKMNKGEYLFKINEQRKILYFIQKGSFKLIIPQCTLNKVNFFVSEFKNIFIEKNIFSNEQKDIIISTIDSGEILGMNDCVMRDNNFFFNALCESNSIYFTIDIKIIYLILEQFNDIKENWRILTNKKNNFMIERLINIQNFFKNSIEGEIKQNSKRKNIALIERFFNESERFSARKKHMRNTIFGNLDLKKGKLNKDNNILRISTKNILSTSRQNNKINQETISNNYYEKSFPKICLTSPNKIKLNSNNDIKNYSDKKESQELNEYNKKKSLYKLFRKNHRTIDKINDLPEFKSGFFQKLLETDNITKALFENRLKNKSNEKNENNTFNYSSKISIGTSFGNSNIFRKKIIMNVKHKKISSNLISKKFKNKISKILNDG
jgi:CRP-like cAMP-binding protein